MMRQLDERNGDGIVVQLLWDDSENAHSEVVVDYRDARTGVCYTVRAPRDRALDVFHHPNAYATAVDAA